MAVSVKTFFDDVADVVAVRHGAGGKLRQPIGDLVLRDPVLQKKALDALYDDAAIAQCAMDRIGAFLAERFESEYTPRAKPKNRDRVIEKADQRYRGDYSYVSDLACGMLKMPQHRIGDVIDQLCGDNPDSRALRGALADMGVVVMDRVENRISFPDKSDMRNLATKLAVEITREDGRKTYHVCELQCVHEKAAPLYKKSHDHFEVMRSAKVEYQRAEAKRLRLEAEQARLAEGGTPCYRALRQLDRQLGQAQESYDTHRAVYEQFQQKRAEANREATRITGKPGINAFLGYQPRMDSMAERAENVAMQPVMGIESRRFVAQPA